MLCGTVGVALQSIKSTLSLVVLNIGFIGIGELQNWIWRHHQQEHLLLQILNAHLSQLAQTKDMAVKVLKDHSGIVTYFRHCYVLYASFG